MASAAFDELDRDDARTAVAALAVLAAVELALVPVGTAAFLGMAAVLGMGTGAVYGLLQDYTVGFLLLALTAAAAAGYTATAVRRRARTDVR